MGIYILGTGLVWKVKGKQNFKSTLHVEFQKINGIFHGLADMTGLLSLYFDEFRLILESCLCYCCCPLPCHFSAQGNDDGCSASDCAQEE